MPRYNRTPNPAFDNNTNGWAAQNTQAAPRRYATARGDGVTGYAVDARSTGNNQRAILYTNSTSGRAPVTPGQTYTVSIYVYHGAGRTIDVRLDVDFYTSSGSFQATAPGSPMTPVAHNTWTRIRHTATAPGNADVVSTWAEFYTTGVTYVVASCAMVEDGPTSPNYRDGNSTGWEWLGTRGNSASREIETGPEPGRFLLAI